MVTILDLCVCLEQERVRKNYQAAGRGETWALVLLLGAGGHFTLASAAGHGPFAPAQRAGQLLTGAWGVPASGAHG